MRKDCFMNYSQMSKEQLAAEKSNLMKRYEDFKLQNLKLDMSRGKPSKEQLDISMGLVNTPVDYTENGFDLRNYGLLDGISSCKKLFAEILEVKPENIVVGGSASLNLMFDYVCQCFTKGVEGCTPWCKLDEVKFLCPVPGYDRHFTICEYFGIKMVNVPMTSEGPDMNVIEELVKDESVKGMFCVPKYSNPQGITYSDETVKKIASLKPAAKDFRIIWDNAYCVHDLDTENPDKLLNIFSVLGDYGNENMVIEVASTAKITFPGAGVSCIAASEENVADIKKRLNCETISYDKMNQKRHSEYFKSAADVKEHMKKHAEIIKPKFEMVLKHLDNELKDTGIAHWENPNGGYFISLDVMPQTAKRTGELCKEAGVALTPVGATFPYGIDPEDKNIRIAPTLPPLEELDKAAELLCICAKIAAIEKLVG